MINPEILGPLFTLLPGMTFGAVYLYPVGLSRNIGFFTESLGKGHKRVEADNYSVGLPPGDIRYGVKVPDGGQGGMTNKNINPHDFTYVEDYSPQSEPAHAEIFQNKKYITTLNADHPREILPDETLAVWQWEEW